MIKIEYSGPMIVSGALITDEIIKELRHLQKGTRWCEKENLPFTNEGFNELMKDLTDVVYQLLNNMVEADAGKEKEKAIGLLARISLIQSTFDSFKVPEEMLD